MTRGRLHDLGVLPPIERGEADDGEGDEGANSSELRLNLRSDQRPDRGVEEDVAALRRSEMARERERRRELALERARERDEGRDFPRP